MVVSNTVFVMFTLKIGEMIQFHSYFANGLVQPPTRINLIGEHHRLYPVYHILNLYPVFVEEDESNVASYIFDGVGSSTT